MSMSLKYLGTRFLISLSAFACLPACSGNDDSKPSTEVQPEAVVARYASIAEAGYGDSVTGVVKLKAAIDALVQSPTTNALDAARQAWIDARVPYLQTEVFRFYGGPIDGDKGPEDRINSWPMDENYIDYIATDANAGIINHAKDYPKIDAPTLIDLNFKEGETTISTGFHAIEFLLWGQDLYRDTPGRRPYTDYVSGSGGTAQNQDRRRLYLTTVAQLLHDDLQWVVDQWTSGQNNYGATFTHLPVKDALEKMLRGMGSLSGAELSGERMQVAYDTKASEDEHSCFSDTTDQDLLHDAIGIENIYLGRYGGEEGPGLSDLVRAKNRALDAKMKTQLHASVEAIRSIPQPFDQAILGDDSAEGRKRIKAAIDALLAQTATTVEIADLLGIQLNLEK